MRILLVALLAFAVTAVTAPAATVDGMHLTALFKAEGTVAFEVAGRNTDADRTVSRVDLFIPRTLHVDPKGVPVCPRERVLRLRCAGRSGSPRVGTIRVNALGDRGSRAAQQRSVQLYRLDRRGTMGALFFQLPFASPSYTYLVRARLTKLSGRYGQRLRIKLPIPLVGAVGTYASLRDFSLYLGAKHGRRSFVTASDCKRGAHRFKMAFHFIDNGRTPPGDATAKARARCS